MFFNWKAKSRRKRAYTLVEVMVAAGLFGIVSAAICSIYAFSTRSFATLANYAQLDQVNRNALDQLTQEIRQSKIVTAVTNNGISLINKDGASVTYTFSSQSQKLERRLSGQAPTVLVSHCSLLNFKTYQRNLQAGTWDFYTATNNVATIQVIQLQWVASRPIPGGPGLSENVQTAQVVMRNQKYYSQNH